MKTIVLVTGGFDPLHSGHIAYFEEAAKLGDELIVGVNSDAWLTRKKGKPFMPFKERIAIITSLRMVSGAIDFDDSDGGAGGAIFKCKEIFGNDCKIIFANGGDRSVKNIPELVMYGDDPQVEFMFGVGGDDKKNSSSWILDEFKNPKVVRPWGWYRDLYTIGKEIKVKELVIEPGKQLSMQKHSKRAEMWYVLKGKCKVVTILNNVPDEKVLNNLGIGYDIGKEVWHQGVNPYDKPCHILEVQHGEECVESDIMRIGVDDDYGQEGQQE